MKNICLLAATAQSTYIDKEVFNISAFIVFAAIFMAFILSVLRQLLDHRIKTRLTDSGLPESVISSLLQQEPNAGKLNAAKWAIIFAGLGIACTIIYYTLPLGIHSIAILAFSLSAAFAGYSLLLHQLKK